MNSPEYFEKLLKASSKLKKLKGWGLCEFADRLGINRRASEAEMMVDQTIRAAQMNLEDNGQAFSFVSPSVHSFSNGGIIDNGTAWSNLIKGGWITVSKVHSSSVKVPPKDLKSDSEGNYQVCYPSEKLIDAVLEHLESE